YQFHRGSLTTQHFMKRMNRFFEWNLPAVEGIATLAATLLRNKSDEESSKASSDSYFDVIPPFRTFYTGEKDQIRTTGNPIQQMWYNTLLMQFHDVLPGSSIPEVYDECYEFWSQDRSLLRRLRTGAIKALAQAIPSINTKVQKIKLSEIEFEIFLFPILLVNAGGTSISQVVETEADAFDDFIPVCVLERNSNVESGICIKPIQQIPPDAIGFRNISLDRKSERYVFTSQMDSWSVRCGWIAAVRNKVPFNTMERICRKIRNMFLPKNSKNRPTSLKTEANITIETTGDHITMQNEGKDESLHVIIDKKTGMIEQILHNGSSLLKELMKFSIFTDIPYKNPCWNFPVNWWENGLDTLIKRPTIELIADGPVKWTVRVKTNLRKHSKLIVDYSLISGVPGLSVEIGLEFHEIEELVKLTLPVNIDTEYSIAETPYATSTRKNIPTANHDKPRWEKWMHTFVVLEDKKKKHGLAVINEGKYGFDTINGDLSISIIHGPEYPEVDVVSWIKEERKKRLKEGLGSPPTHADQGECLTRLWLLPYSGSWRDGQVHHAAHAFNAPYSINVFYKEPAEVSEIKVSDFKTIVSQQLSEKRFIKSNNRCIEITVIKPADPIPKCFKKEIKGEDSQNYAIKDRGLVFRTINNSNNNAAAEISISSDLLMNFERIVETDLLERPLSNGLNYVINRNRMADNIINIKFAPHQIRTFELQ
ncbi:MAG: hypothetical protein GF364_21695, partial [Candidatus Lokiarchaeota archaeon]|nr:hypothetical protein [Candidatus Lokiarchaeota archaeon]